MNLKILNNIVNGKVYAIIPARSGSKGVKNKNIRNINGYPLIAYSIASAIQTKNIERVIVSTDSPQYAEISRYYGAETPFLRPKTISGDTSTDLEFFEHAINWFFENEKYVPEYLVHLRATCPLRDPNNICAAVEKIKLHPEATSLISACIPKGVLTPYKWFVQQGDYFKSIFFENNDDANRPRQSYPIAYMRSIYVDIIKTETVVKEKRLFGSKIIPWITEETIDIDSEEDFYNAENVIKNKGIVLTNYLKGMIGNV